MRIGLIGCGGMGTIHNHALTALAAEIDITVTALADCRAEFLNRAAASWPQAKCYQEGFKLLEQESLDAVHICTPSYLHAQMVKRALEKGMNVFVEKPVCLTEAECQILEKKQKITQKSVMVGQVIRFFPEYRYLKNVFTDGKYGKLKSIIMRRVSGNPTWGFEDWFHDPQKSGSVILDLHIHDTDFLRYLLGEPDSIEVSAARFPSGLVNQIITTYTYKDVFANAEGIWDVSEKIPFEASYRACFEQATIVFNGRNNPSLTIYEGNGSIKVPELFKEYDVKDTVAGINISEIGSYYAEIKYFYECLQQRKINEVAPLSEGIASVRLALLECEKADRYW